MEVIRITVSNNGQLFLISSYTTLASYLVEILIVELHYNATGG